MISLILLLLVGMLTQCTKDYPYGVYCAECKAYEKVNSTDPNTNEEIVTLKKVNDKSWCDSRPVDIFNFFTSYKNSFDTLMSVSEDGREYCVVCETLSDLQAKEVLSNCD